MYAILSRKNTVIKISISIVENCSRKYDFTFIFEHKLSDAFVLIVVPHHDLVNGIPRIPPSTHNGNQVAPE